MSHFAMMSLNIHKDKICVFSFEGLNKSTDICDWTSTCK